MSASNKSWLALVLLLVAAMSGCSSLVNIDRTKIHDDLFTVPDAGRDGGDEDAGE